MPKKDQSKPKLIVTHSANFHVDDVFGTACVILLMEKKGFKYKVKRSLDPKVWAEGDIVLDIGRVYNPSKNRFDHHQDLKITHKNGIKYAAFGLVWKKYGKFLCGSQKVADRVEEKLVIPVDAEDNGVDLYKPIIDGVKPFGLKDIIENECSVGFFGNNSSKEDPKRFDKSFMNLLPFAKFIIESAIEESKNYSRTEKIAEKCFKEAKDKRVLILPQFLGYGFSKMKEPLVTIYPDARGNWSAKTVRVNPGQFDSRIYFPKSWAGLNGDEMAKVSGVPDAHFCHKGLFLAVAKTKEGAIALVNAMFKEAGFLPVKV